MFVSRAWCKPKQKKSSKMILPPYPVVSPPMKQNDHQLPRIQRQFRDLTDAEITDIEQVSALYRAGWRGGFGWDELLRSKRILIVSEAGAGKTYECRIQRDKLWNAGEPAFFLELSTLALSMVRDMLDQEEEVRFDSWLRSQSEVATFFLDSIDELNLTLGKFDQALKRLSKALEGQIGRARVVITTRPIPVDRQLIEKHLPIPKAASAEPTAEAFADMMMNEGTKKKNEESEPKPWRYVGLLPLSRDQIRTFALLQGVTDPDVLLADIHRRDADEFAERPQDLIEICSDWRENRRIGTHRAQVESNVNTKLRPSTERKERADLSLNRAIEGASRLALALLLTRRLTLRYSVSADDATSGDVALDPSKILLDWTPEEIGALLERPLFGFASYGRVRFHHRSVIDYLAAKHLAMLLDRGVPVRAIKRLLFADTVQGIRTVRPSLRPVAAWLAISCESIVDETVTVDPSVALDYGDPQSLRPAQRIKALEAYVARYRFGGWRGLHVPRVQVHRFSSNELGPTVRRLWTDGVENDEVRDLLLAIIGAGKLIECSDLCYAHTMDKTQPIRERCQALDALVQIADKRIDAISSSIETDAALWPADVARKAILVLFPEYLPAKRLLNILQRIDDDKHTVGDLNYRLPREIEYANIQAEYLDTLRQGLTELLLAECEWDQNHYPHLQTKRPFLIPALVATCLRQSVTGVATEAWAFSTLIALRLSANDHSEKNSLETLRRTIVDLPPNVREAAYWQEDTLQEKFHQHNNPWNRVFDLSYYGGIQLTAEKDDEWVRKHLADPNEPLDRREMMLRAEGQLLVRPKGDFQQILEGLKPLVADAPSLLEIIDGWLMQPAESEEVKRLRAQQEKHAKQRERRHAKDHASWVMFWREINENPDKVFSPDRADNTVWNLWNAMERSGEKSRSSGWNRRFIEAQFGKEIADRLRQTMMAAWRKDKPTLRSERPAAERNTFLVRWQLGLAGIAAEAEAPNWAKRLTDEEAALACRYAPIELNGFPSWLESVAVEYPAVVDRVLGEELTYSLREMAETNEYSMFLQNVAHASPIVAALFVPRVRAWLAQVLEAGTRSNHSQFEQNLRQAVGILMKNGNDRDRQFLQAIARQQLAADFDGTYSGIWLPVLLQLNPAEGVELLEKGLSTCPVGKTGPGAKIFAGLFGRDDTGTRVDLSASAFTPQLLLRLVRIAYQQVRVEEDQVHEGSYSPDTRDNAERGRDAVLSALLATTGKDGWDAKIEMANDPLFSHFKDRAVCLASEKSAEEADRATISEAEFVILDRSGEAPPTTSSAMFALLRDRLDDIDDLLLQDESPREAWSGIKDERVMRRELARALKAAANGNYKVDQEAVTADEKETDIRLRSTGSYQQATIELKLGDERSGSDLFNTISDQLLKKYMATEECRAGCLLVTVSKDREWEHPATGAKIDFDTLIRILNAEAERISLELSGTVKLMARGLDLRRRIGTEKQRSAQK